MLDKSIDGALLALRKRIIRGSSEGLAHVEALLAMRGVPMPAVLPPKRRDVARKGLMRLLILDGMRKGCRRQREIAAHVRTHRPELTVHAASKRTAQALQKMKVAGMVRREGRVWRLLEP